MTPGMAPASQLATGYYCTGRGDHDYAVVSPPFRQYQNAADLRCPVCGLTKKLGYQIRNAIADSGLAEVDISALPF